MLKRKCCRQDEQEGRAKGQQEEDVSVVTNVFMYMYPLLLGCSQVDGCSCLREMWDLLRLPLHQPNRLSGYIGQTPQSRLRRLYPAFVGG